MQIYMHMPSGAFRRPVVLTHPLKVSVKGRFPLPSQSITWLTASTGECVYELGQPQNPQLYLETPGGHAECGQFYFATAMVCRF
jgi:hypothetical protein